ncbi:oligosaccharide flippase family protein [Rhizomicrobium electricum]|uniref:Flippase n=1 Tax=Rhizomicrobium electricum TaxID=480070 RepID=A0ABP3P9A3_9PROT|nr:oligosaccharide flippase family protein [Rhizomicrobium electricum]NIJ48120.1 O-antigen/teichoic acid export membrane protein [Rhizomicrobium electricum]
MSAVAAESREIRKFVRNAASNVINGLSGAFFGLVLPFFFVRTLSAGEFALWILVLQLGGYVGYLSFGLQIAIGRYVAHALERGDRPFAEKMLAAGLQILSVLAIGGLMAMLVLAWAFPAIFRQVPPDLVATARWSLVWVGAALAAGLPVLGILGVFIGLQRNDIPAATGTVSKLTMGVVLVAVAYVTSDLVAVCAAYFFCNIATYVVQGAVFRRMCPDWRLSFAAIDPAARRELVTYCISLSVWSLGTLVVNGLQTTIVGIYDFAAVGAYGAALNLVTFAAGVAYTILSPLVQVFAKQHALGKSAEMMRLLHTASTATSLALLAGGAWLVLLAQPIFVAWIKQPLAAVAIPVFTLLVIANVARVMAMPYMNFLIGSGRQGRVVLTPVLECAVNLTVGLVLAAHIGVIGVAIGTLAGGVVGNAANFLYNMPRTLPQKADISALVASSLVRPLVSCVPLIAAVALTNLHLLPAVAGYALTATATVLPAYRFLKLRRGTRIAQS